MKKFFKLMAFFLIASSTAAVASFPQRSDFIPLSSAQNKTQVGLLNKAQLSSQLRAKLMEFGENSESNESTPTNIKVAVYIHPIYLNQSYVETKTEPQEVDPLELNGSLFVYGRVQKYLDDISFALSSSGANVNIQLSFVGVVPNDFPILSSSGAGEVTAPDGVTNVKTDAEYFDLIMQDWGGVSAKYGFDENHPLRRMRAVSGADLHIYMRPFIEENTMASADITKAKESFIPGKKIEDTESGFGFILSTMTVYDSYWYLGANNIAPDSNYALKVAPHNFGHVLDAGHEEGLTTSTFTYGKAYECGGFKTIMNSTITPTTSYIYSTPTKSVDGEPCGIAKGQAGEADNLSVINEQAPLLSVAGNPSSSDVLVYLSAPIRDIYDGIPQEISLFRTGDLSKDTVVTLISEPGTAIEGNIHGDVANADYYFGMKTLIIPSGQQRASTDIEAPERTSNSAAKTLSVRVLSVSNGQVEPAASSIDFTVQPNVSEPVSIMFGEIKDSYLEGDEVQIVLEPQTELDREYTLSVIAESSTLVDGVNYELLTPELNVTPSGSESRLVRIRLIDDKKFTEQKSIQLSLKDGSELLDSAIINIEEASEPDAGVIYPQNNSVKIDNLAGKVSINLIRQESNKKAHRFVIRLKEKPSNIDVSSVDLPDVMEMLVGEDEKVAEIGFTSPAPATYKFEIYSETKAVVMSEFMVEVTKSVALPTVQMNADYVVNENVGVAKIQINRDKSETDLSLAIQFIEDTAKVNADFLDNTKSVTFQAGQAAAVIEIPILDSKAIVGDRSFKIKISSDLANYSVDTATILIKDVERDPEYGDKVDDYQAGPVGIAYLLLLPLIFIRRRLKI